MTIINEYVPLNISSPITSPIAIQKQVIPVKFPLWFLFHPGLGGRSHHAATTGRRCREARSLRQFKTLGMVWVCPWLWGDNMRTIGISCMTMTYWENLGKTISDKKVRRWGQSPPNDICTLIPWYAIGISWNLHASMGRENRHRMGIHHTIVIGMNQIAIWVSCFQPFWVRSVHPMVCTIMLQNMDEVYHQEFIHYIYVYISIYLDY